MNPIGKRTAIAGATVLGLGAASALLLPGLGHDAWAWMIWAREIAHFDLDTTTGSTIKPLPMLLMAPFGPIGDMAPFIWLALSRAAWLAIPVVAWLGGDRLGGRRAAAFAAAGALLVPVLFDATVNGYSESLTALSLLGAALALLSNRPTPALALIATAGLMRPEAWAFSLAIGVWGGPLGRGATGDRDRPFRGTDRTLDGPQLVGLGGAVRRCERHREHPGGRWCTHSLREGNRANRGDRTRGGPGSGGP